MHSSFGCIFFALLIHLLKMVRLSKSYLIIDIGLNDDDERWMTNTTQKQEQGTKIWNVGKQWHALFILHFAEMDVALISFYSIIFFFWNAVNTLPSQLAYYFHFLSFHFISFSIFRSFFSFTFFFLHFSFVTFYISTYRNFTRGSTNMAMFNTLLVTNDEAERTYVCMHVIREWKLMRCNYPVIVNN